ncbi:dienelactone hydrolase family protein [Nannocystis sp. SCPEA4]|uniref:dienelactone hydrolase family protein n=1 Tax=Nannocystis sp. SCPEA4 TaxID=2996787 RepID=UPI002271938E|nr:dienelactone hydrolase family protein [Nannocystis sp. SCPEA4]MCY1057483.1 dienelactone hydrolase family protein [Nannocystis sp. SCPEA4]
MHTRIVLPVVAAALAWIAAPARAQADTYTNISFDSLTPGLQLDGRLYLPDSPVENPPAIIMAHGCSGMWSYNDPSTEVAQLHIEKWGIELAAQGYVVLAVDSFTTRTPTGEDEVEFQNQCSGDDWEGEVDPYTKRVDDLAAARAFLIDEYEVNTAGGIGLLGWSQGAQAVLVAMAATPRTSNVAYTTELPWAAATAFYPGCGSLMGYGFKISQPIDGYWRPANPVRLHMGEADSLHAHCKRRVDNAWDVYDADPGTADELVWRPYPFVGHSFDRGDDTTFPTSKCSPEEAADTTRRAECAMRDADVDSLAFFLARVQAPAT